MKFLVIGDSCTDTFIYGNCERICPEAPVPVFNPVRTIVTGGMSKNVQRNIQALNVECDVVTNDNNILKTRYVDKKTNQMLLRVDENDFTEERFNIKSIDFSSYDAIVISDYDKGFLHSMDINFICLKHDHVFLDTKRKIDWWLPASLRYLKINQYEYDNSKSHLMLLEELLPDKLIVTRSGAGCMFRHKLIPPPVKVEARDLSGAGDTFLAGFAVAIMRGDGVYKSIDFAQECAATVVAKRGVATVS